MIFSCGGMEIDELDRGQVTRKGSRIGLAYAHERGDVELFVDELPDVGLGLVGLVADVQRDLFQPGVNGPKVVFLLRLEFAREPQRIAFDGGVHRQAADFGEQRQRQVEIAGARVSFSEQQFGAIGEIGVGKFTEQLIDIADRFGMLFHAEHGGGHQQIGIVEEVRRGAALHESSQHDGCCFRLFRVDQPFDLVEAGLACGGRRFGLSGTGRRRIFGGWSCLAERDKPREKRHREGDGARAVVRAAGY